MAWSPCTHMESPLLPWVVGRYFEILSATSTHITVGIMPAAQALSNPDGDFLNSAAQGGWGFYQRSGCVGHGGPAATAYHRP